MLRTHMSNKWATPMTRRQKFKDGARRLRVKVINKQNIPGFVTVLNLLILMGMICFQWLGNPHGPEMPYGFVAPLGSLFLSALMMWYNWSQYSIMSRAYKASNSTIKPPKQVLVTGALGIVFTAGLMVLAILYPTKDPCCPGGQIADRVKKGSCKPPSPASSPQDSSPQDSSPQDSSPQDSSPGEEAGEEAGASPEGASPEGASPEGSSPGPASSPEGASVTE